MKEIEEITDQLITFREERNWAQFHDPKDLALAISIEASELNELFLWKRNEEEINEVSKEKVAEELADIFAFAFLMAEKYNFDVKEIVLEKIKKNKEKYPVEKSLGRSTKYTDLR